MSLPACPTWWFVGVFRALAWLLFVKVWCVLSLSDMRSWCPFGVCCPRIDGQRVGGVITELCLFPQKAVLVHFVESSECKRHRNIGWHHIGLAYICQCHLHQRILKVGFPCYFLQGYMIHSNILSCGGVLPIKMTGNGVRGYLLLISSLHDSSELCSRVCIA